MDNVQSDSFLWLIVLYLFMKEEEHQTDLLWKEFEEEIKFKSRFFPKSSLLEKIEKSFDNFTLIAKKGETFLRARVYKTDEEPGKAQVEELYKSIQIIYPELELSKKDINDEHKFDLITIQLARDGERYRTLREKWRKIFVDGEPFWGYDSENSDAPDSRVASAGRANSAHISYLYVADDLETAILEVRATVRQPVSVATVELTNDIKLFDFNLTQGSIRDENMLQVADINVISNHFSAPNFGNSADYYATQYICEFLKEKGYDGIKFKSSMKENGNNIVLFETDKIKRHYKITGSKIYVVNGLEIKINQFLPME